MIRKKIYPIINREEENERKKLVGMAVECRLFGFLLYRKIIYTPARYDLHRVDGEINLTLVNILLNG